MRLTIMQRFITTAILSTGLAVAAQNARSNPWTCERDGDGWTGSVHDAPGHARLHFGFPAHREVAPPASVTIARDFEVPPKTPVTLTFQWADDFQGATRGYHVLVALIDGTPVWEDDVAGGGSDASRVHVDVTEHCAGKEHVTVALRARTRRRVTNFRVAIQVKGVELISGVDTGTERRPYLPPPPDPELPRLPINGLDWTPRATVLQPWGRTQYAAMHDAGDLPRRLAEQYGFNTMIVLPPDAHSFTAPEDCRLSDTMFRQALAGYRQAGFRVLLYSSIMHLGHSRAWEDGTIAREHPEWAQRNAQGGTIRKYGQPWLCPSTGALEAAIDYTLDMVRQYSPDGIMLDNNQFMNTPDGGGPTCHCASCQQAFRAYVAQRYGPSAGEHLGVAAEEPAIPVFPGKLMNLWIHWRNRVWAGANERFRQALREVNPTMIFFANTQYGRQGWDLATDLQYVHEDVMLSESRGLDSLGMSAKLTLGTALAHGRPLWNYIGTFREDDFTRLRPPRTVASISAPALAHQVPPWIVYYGFDESNAEDDAARHSLRALLDLRRTHEDLCCGLTPWATVAVLFDTRSRNYAGTPLIPDCIKPLLLSGIPFAGIHAQNLLDTDLSAYDTLVAPHIVCLSEGERGALEKRLATGARLIATPDLARRDELGVQRPTPGLNQAGIGVNAVMLMDQSAIVPRLIGHVNQRFIAGGNAAKQLEFRAYYGKTGSPVLHIVNHGEPLAQAWELALPAAFAKDVGKAAVLRPGIPGAVVRSVVHAAEGPRATLPPVDVYAVVELLE